MHATRKADQVATGRVPPAHGGDRRRLHVRGFPRGPQGLIYWGVLARRCTDFVTDMMMTADRAHTRKGSRHELALGIPVCIFPVGISAVACAMSR